MYRKILVLSALAASGFVSTIATMAQQRSGALQQTVFAIKDAKVVTEPGKVLPQATVVIRDGIIEAIAPDARVPADALVMQGKGMTIYPGFIDALSTWGFDAALRRSEGGPPAIEDYASEALAATKADNRKGVTPEFQVSTALKAEEEQAEAWRKIGISAHVVAPDGGILSGQSALVSLSGAAPREAVLRSPIAQHAAFSTSGAEYPRVLMGFVAHFRQTLLDAGHYQRVWQAYEKSGRAGKRPPLDPALADLEPMLTGKMPVVFEADSKDEINRALDFSEEFKLKPIIYGGREAWKTVDRLKKNNVPVIVKIAFTDRPTGRGGRRGGFGPPAAPTTPAPGTPTTPTQGQGRGRRGNQNPATTPPGTQTPATTPAVTGAEEETPVPARVQEDRQRELKEEIRNAGILEKAGILFAFSTQGQPANGPADRFKENLRKTITEGDLPADAALRALTTNAAKILGVDKQLGTLAPGKAAHLIVADGDFNQASTQIKYVFSDGVRFDYDTRAIAATPGGGGRGQGKAGGAPPTGGAATGAAGAQAKTAEKSTPPTPKTEYATELESDRKPKLKTGGNVLIRGANIVTVSNGTQFETDLLVQKGKIVKLGKNLDAPEGVLQIHAEGMFIMPGIIDTHCHFAVSGGVNESTLSVVPEVRIRDVINSDDVQIFRALAGGVTTSRLLHGSANVIGGQDAVIKLKYGQPASQLLIADAPRGVKFALGENVKRTDGRFPNTRLGVEAVLIRAFEEAKAYRHEWDEYKKATAANKPATEPRRDLRLEALVDILRGDLKVHSHCYRSDEILMLLRVADRFGFKVQSLQHVLEGYKIAPEIAAHGASCSTFSDWWAYKIEAYDAIPFNSALLNEAGAVVCIKSDDNELMRHLYQEAAKCVKYGGMSENDALKTITLNGAKQLGLEKRLGTIELGKDADLAIFNGYPLNGYSRVEMTLVDGEVYFQRAEHLAPAGIARSAIPRPRPEFAPIPRNDSGSYVISGVTVHPVSGPEITPAVVAVNKGKIVGVRKGVVMEKPRSATGAAAPAGQIAVIDEGKQSVLNLPAGAQLINGQGLHLYPGMIDAATVLGLTELGSARETQDFAEGGDFQPDLRAGIGINPDSELIPVTRANGVTTVLTRPTGSMIAGQSALINLAGWVPREMAVVDPVGLHVEFPSAFRGAFADPAAPRALGAINRRQRDDKIRKVKDLFEQAKVYDLARKQTPDKAVNPRLEALVPYARGEKPVVIQANRLQEINEALKLAEDLKLKVVLSGALDAWKVAAELKKRDIPVIVGPMLSLPQDTNDPFDAPYACPAKLHEAGVKYCIRSAGNTNTRNLPYEAAMAISYGLTPEEGLKSVTLYPAQILGVADKLGSIEEGKMANLVLTDGDMLQATTQVKALFINGQPLEPASKHTKLYERYRERLKEVKAGKAPLGTN